jgi:hypothetical protein
MHQASEAGGVSPQLDEERRATAAARRSAAAAASEAERARLDLARVEAQLAAIRHSSTWRTAAMLNRLIQAWPGLHRLLQSAAQLASPRAAGKNASASVPRSRGTGPATMAAPAAAIEPAATAGGIDLLVDLSESGLDGAGLADHLAALRTRFVGFTIAEGSTGLAAALAAAAGKGARSPSSAARGCRRTS